MTRLLFVRHGETEHNVLGQICTHTDGVVLSERGFIQAHDLAQRLSKVSLSAVYSSPMVRALQTATVLAEPHGLSVLTCADLRELSAGELDGRNDEEAFRILNAGLDAWCLGNDAERIGSTGDIGRDIISRFAGVIARIRKGHDRETVALVSHGGLLQMGIPWACSNLPNDYGYRRHIGNSAVIEIDASTETVCLSWEGVLLSDIIPSVLP